MSRDAGFIRTALGDIDPSRFGRCSSHEHVIIDDPYVAERFVDFDLSNVDEAAEELKLFAAAGGGSVVETMPAGCGRNPIKSAAASEKSGVHVVLATGMHLRKYYRDGHWLLERNEADLTDFFVRDIVRGIGESDDAPDAPPTGLRAGVIKVAGGLHRLDDFQQRLFRAAAGAQRHTGCPIITHTERGTAAMEQVRLLIDSGTRAGSVVLSHMDRLEDPAVHEALLATGVRLEYDAAFRWGDRSPNPTVERIAELAPRYPKQILLGMDLARRSTKRSLGGRPGLAWLIEGLVPMLSKRGVEETLIERMLVDNPAETFAFYKAAVDWPVATAGADRTS